MSHFLEIWNSYITKHVGQIPPNLTVRRRGGPMCPPGRNTVRVSPIFGEFVIPTTSGHTLHFSPMFGEFVIPPQEDTPTHPNGFDCAHPLSYCTPVPQEKKCRCPARRGRGSSFRFTLSPKAQASNHTPGQIGTSAPP